MNWNIVNIKGEKVKTVELAKQVFEQEMNEAVLHSVVKAYQANRRQGTHATKTRSLVSGTGKKPFKQKGTGSARQGDSRSPLFPGGAVLHGPQPRSYRQDVNRKQRQLALRVALSDKVRHNKLVLVDDFAVEKYSTKSVAKVLQALGCLKGALLADVTRDDLLYRSTRNIYRADVLSPMDLNAEDVLRHESLILSEKALKAIEERLGGSDESV